MAAERRPPLRLRGQEAARLGWSYHREIADSVLTNRAGGAHVAVLDRSVDGVEGLAIAGKEGNPMAAAYSASKAVVIAMTKTIGKDVAGTGVLVNCIAPAVIDADPFRPLGAARPLHGRADPSSSAAAYSWASSDLPLSGSKR